MPSDVALIVPTLCGRRWLEETLAAVAAQSVPPRETVVVLNGAAEETARWLAAAHPSVRTLAPGRNLGFAGAVELALRSTDAPLVAILNDDARPEPGWLAALSAALAADPTLAFACGKTLRAGASGVLDAAGDGLGPGLLPYPIGRFERDEGQYRAPRPLLLASMCAVLVRRAMLEEAGSIAADFFAYFEDADLGLRLALRGRPGRYVPAAVVHHVGSATTGGMINPVTVRLSTRNLIRLQVRTFPLGFAARRLHRLAFGHLYWFAKMAVKERRAWSWARGVAGGLACLPRDLRSRRRILASRAIDDAAFGRLADASACEVRASIRRKRAARGGG